MEEQKSSFETFQASSSSRCWSLHTYAAKCISYLQQSSKAGHYTFLFFRKHKQVHLGQLITYIFYDPNYEMRSTPRHKEKRTLSLPGMVTSTESCFKSRDHEWYKILPSCCLRFASPKRNFINHPSLPIRVSAKSCTQPTLLIRINSVF